MKILSIQEVKKWEEIVAHKEGSSLQSLMEVFAQGCKDFITQNFNKSEAIHIYCGNQKKAGYGLLLARLLYLEGFFVEVILSESYQSLSKDFQQFFLLLKETGITILDGNKINEEFIHSASIIIDALGNGDFDSANCNDLVEKINTTRSIKIALDEPFGIIDNQITKSKILFHYTLVSSLYKKHYLHPETGVFCGRLIMINSKIPQEIIDEMETNEYLVSEKYINKIYQPRNQFSHKGDFGKASLVVGSYGKMGAAVLSVKAALRSGVGITYLNSPKCGNIILQTSCPEAIFKSTGENETEIIEHDKSLVYGVGCGIGIEAHTAKAFLKLIQEVNGPMVIDADALNILSKNPEYLKFIPKNSILTPHPKEFERLFGASKDSFEMQELTKIKAKELDCYIVLKGHYTQIITPNQEVYYNNTGNVGLAKGGSGDVLLGIITSLLAQGYSSFEASVLGVWIHGRAADFAVEKHSIEALLASDVVDFIGEVFKELENKKGKY